MLAPEGTYMCWMAPAVCHRLLADLDLYLELHDMDAQARRESIRRCQQPRMSLAHAVQGHIPELWKVLQRPKEFFTDLVSTENRRKVPVPVRINRFVQLCLPVCHTAVSIREMAGMGIHITFYADHRHDDV